jgi:hypothetical protein
MKNLTKQLLLVGTIIGICTGTQTVQAQTAPLTNVVSGSNGSNDYIVNGQNDPTLTLFRGVTYRFQVFFSTGITHPFYIRTNSNFATGSLYTNGVTGQGANGTTLTFAVPTDAPNQLIYQCGNHPSMMGFLNMTNAPVPPPTVIIVNIMVTETNVIVTSTGAAGWSPIPEFSSNLTENAWATVPGFANNFSSGTNTTTFDRLDPICGPNVFVRVRNQQN